MSLPFPVLKSTNGFSLVELLVVITIIALVSGLGLSITASLRQSSQDAQRKADLSLLQSALQQFYADKNKYPNDLTSVLSSGGALTNCSGESPPCTVTKTYLSKTPRDPVGTSYYYRAMINQSQIDTSCGVGIGICHYYFLCALLDSPPTGSSTCYIGPYNYQIAPI